MYSIGLDFGTLSGRAVLVDTQNGTEVADAEYAYPHGVMDRELPSGVKLGEHWALQDPKDYVEVIEKTIPEVMRKSGISSSEVVGIGTDFTACTILPVMSDGTPLCTLPEFKNEPNAYPKLWKHHAAQPWATKLNETAALRGEAWLENYGGRISSEFGVPKIWQVLDEAPEVYARADKFIEASDWIVWQLTGRETRNTCAAGYKELWSKRDGFPGRDFFAALDPRLETLAETKLKGEMLAPGSLAGGLTAEMARRTGLKAGTPVAAGGVDAHACAPAVGMDGPGKMMAIIGTSSCHMVLGESGQQVPGVCGIVEDGIMPGYFGYESGQSGVGDIFAWFVKGYVPKEYDEEAKARGISLHSYLSELSEKMKPGDSGLLALDWWNGNRSILTDAELTGALIGMTLQTKPEEIYRALVEATAFGTRMIVENYRKHGVPVNSFCASGGISQKSSLAMQIYADVLDMEIKISDSRNGPALGSAIFGAVVGGEYPDVYSAAKAMGRLSPKSYRPISENVAAYSRIFAEYEKLHDYFGRGGNTVMKTLLSMKK